MREGVVVLESGGGEGGPGGEGAGGVIPEELGCGGGVVCCFGVGVLKRVWVSGCFSLAFALFLIFVG